MNLSDDIGFVVWQRGYKLFGQRNSERCSRHSFFGPKPLLKCQETQRLSFRINLFQQPWVCLN